MSEPQVLAVEPAKATPTERPLSDVLDELEAAESKQQDELLNLSVEDIRKLATPQAVEKVAEPEAPAKAEATVSSEKPHAASKMFATKEDAEKHYNSLLHLLDKQGNELGLHRTEAAKLKQEIERLKANPRTDPNINRPIDPAQEFDPFDKQSVDNYLAKKADVLFETKYGSRISEIDSKVKEIEAERTRLSAEAKENRYREQARKLGEEFPDDFAINGDMQTVIDAVTHARTHGVDPNTVHPDAAKVMKIMELVGKVESSKGILEDLKHAYAVELSRGDGLKKLLLDSSKKATLDTVKKINEKQKGAPSLSEAPGKTELPQKAMKDLSLKEAFGLLNELPDEDM